MTSKINPQSGEKSEEIPEYLGRYRLVKRISTGGMSHVYEARRESLAGVAPKVAIKVILPEHAKDENFRKLFINEARIGSQLQHPNLVQIQDFDQENDRYYLVMEFVEGPTLRRIISRCKRGGVEIPLSIVAEVGRQMCEGLDYAHNAKDDNGRDRNLIHRDIKPGNVIVNPQGVVKILDFGISKVMEGVERNDGIKGTWGYMSPEQSKGSGVTAVSDLWGVAVVLFELAKLTRLFPGRDPEVIRERMSSDDAARQAANLSGQYRNLGPVLVRALQRDPAARYKNTLEMARALAELVPDPIIVRENLVDFQAKCNTPNIEGRGHVLINQDSMRSNSTIGRVHSSKPFKSGGFHTGIPVSVGTAHRPLAPGEIQPEERPSDRKRNGPSTLNMVAIGLAVAIMLLVVSLLVFERGDNSLTNSVEETVEAIGRDNVAVERLPLEPLVPQNTDVEVTAVVENIAPARTTQVNTVEPPTVVDPVIQAVIAQPEEVERRVVEVASQPNNEPAAAMGLVSVSSLPAVEIYVDGVLMGETPFTGKYLSVGPHRIVLQGEGENYLEFGIDVTEEVEVRKIYHFGMRTWMQQ
jgi:serine/threonine protein kinase